MLKQFYVYVVTISFSKSFANHPPFQCEIKLGTSRTRYAAPPGIYKRELQSIKWALKVSANKTYTTKAYQKPRYMTRLDTTTKT